MKRLFSTILMSVFILGIIHAQTGKFVVAASLHEVDCEQQKVYVDLKIKAADSDSYFFLAQQNYRLTFNRSTLAPESVFLESELEISDIVQSPGGMTLYSPHVMTGTRDTLISYSMELTSGDGYFITHDDWVSIGRIGIGIADMTGCFTLQWNDRETFPITYLSEQWNGASYDMTEGTYINLEVCLPDHCSIESQVTDITELPDYQYDIQVAPTLVQNKLRVQYTLPQDVTSAYITIADMQGNVLQKHQKSLTGQNEFTFDVSYLPQGIYLINTLLDGRSIPRKFVKI